MASQAPKSRARAISILLVAFEACKYVLSCPWDNFYRGVAVMARDPNQHLDTWIQKRSEENNFIGLAASIISATTAQLLANTKYLDQAPWTASGSLFISLCLSIVAVIMAMHQTIFLNSVTILASPSEKLNLLLGNEQNRRTDAGAGKQVWRGTFVYSLPLLTLTYSIFCLYIGLSLMTLNALWSRGPHNDWNGAQKIGIATVVGVFLSIVAFLLTVGYQFTPSTRLSASQGTP